MKELAFNDLFRVSLARDGHLIPPYDYPYFATTNATLIFWRCPTTRSDSPIRMTHPGIDLEMEYVASEHKNGSSLDDSGPAIPIVDASSPSEE